MYSMYSMFRGEVWWTTQRKHLDWEELLKNRSVSPVRARLWKRNRNSLWIPKLYQRSAVHLLVQGLQLKIYLTLTFLGSLFFKSVWSCNPQNSKKKSLSSSLASLFGSLKASPVFTRNDETDQLLVVCGSSLWWEPANWPKDSACAARFSGVLGGSLVEDTLLGQVSVTCRNSSSWVYKTTAVTCFFTREEKDRPVVKNRMFEHSESASYHGDVATQGIRLMENYHSIKIHKICCFFNLVDFQDDPRWGRHHFRLLLC